MSPPRGLTLTSSCPVISGQELCRGRDVTAGNGLRLSGQFVFRPRCGEWMRDACRFASGCNADAPHADKTVTANDIAVKKKKNSALRHIQSALSALSLKCDRLIGAVPVYPSNVSLSELIRLLCAVSTLTCWGFISWPVVFLSLQVGFWHNLRSHFPILLRWWGAFPFFMTK